jgi:hypothetical protein
MTKDRRCIACSESGEPDTFQPLHDAGANVVAWPNADEADNVEPNDADSNRLGDVLRELKEFSRTRLAQSNKPE